MIKIKFNKDCINPMILWLRKSKKDNVRSIDELKEILSAPDYQVEFDRYSMEGLPVSGICFNEAVDFFMNFDKKDFVNPRLQIKKESFIKFYNNLEERLDLINMFSSLSDEDINTIENLLINGLPDYTLKEDIKLNIILIISIGNSMGWPYKNYIDYDISNLDLFKDKDDFIHVTAHEIHHLIVGKLLAPDGIKGEELFLQSFAYEGLAVHYNNNLSTLYKPSKYLDRVFCMQDDDMLFYEEHFDEIFHMIQDDYQKSKSLSLKEVQELVGNKYEQFVFLGKEIKQYPTYYFGCYMWGIVDLKYGKEKLFEAIQNPLLFVNLYNAVTEKKYHFK